MVRELFTQLTPYGDESPILSCRVCGSAGELWERTGDVSMKAVMCSHGDPLGPLESGCLLFMPPEDFYYPTRREAIKFWNDFATANLTETTDETAQSTACGADVGDGCGDGRGSPPVG